METSGRKRKREIQEEIPIFVHSSVSYSIKNDRKKRRVSEIITESNKKERAIDVLSPKADYQPLGLHRHLSLRSSKKSLQELALSSWTSKPNSYLKPNSFDTCTWQPETQNFKTKQELLLNKRYDNALKTSDKNRDSETCKNFNVGINRSSLRRSESFKRLRKPIVNLRGSMRLKLAAQLRRDLMKGKQDYTLTNTAGQIDFLQFIGALQSEGDKEQDHELQQKIDFEIKMRDGTAKLLAASRHPAQLLEAAKNLLTSNTRMIAYMSELQKRKTDQVLQRNSSGEVPPVPCSASLSLSNLRVPLMWKDTDYFKNKGDHRRFAVFCLLKIGTEIYDTSLVKDVDRSMPDITFDDVIVFNNIPPDFELHVEVYSHRLSEDLSIASTPKKIKKKINEISTSVGRSVGRRLSGLREDPEFFGHMIVGPKFECIADATLTLDDVKDHISTYDLNFENPSIDAAHTELPLFGNFCCRISGKPQCMNEPIRAGSISIKHSNGNEDEEYWATLKAGALSCLHSSSSADETEDNTLIIPVHMGTQIVKKFLKNGSCIEITNKVQKVKSTHVLCSEDHDYLEKWYTALKQHIFDHESWKQVAEMNMHVEPSTPQKVPVFLRKSTHMYEGSVGDSPMTLVLKRLNMDPKADNSPGSSNMSALSSAESNENNRPSAAKTPPVLRRKGKTKSNSQSMIAKETNC